MPGTLNQYQPSLGLTFYVNQFGIFPSNGGGGTGGGFIGQVHMFAGSTSYVGSAALGQTLQIAQNSALFALLGTNFGGDGVNNFLLPNLGGRTPVEVGGQLLVGQTAGTTATTVTQAMLPPSSGGTPTSFDNAEPSLGLTYGIAVQGVFPGGFATLDSIGVVSAFANGYMPGGFMPCNGQLLPIAQYAPLFALIGITFGGDGQSTFALPDLRDHAIVGAGGSFALGQTDGAANSQITLANMPVEMGGNGTPISNVQPSIALNYLIATQGIFPSNGFTESDNSEPYLGQIITTAFGANVGGNNFLPCDGRLLSISQHTALFTLLGTTYGGDGLTTFALPDLIGRTPVGTGVGPGGIPVLLGQEFGSETTTLTMDDIPALNFSGSNADNQLYGGNLGDTINGLDGNDDLIGNNGDDILNGGGDNDFINGGGGSDTLNGGTGDDSIRDRGHNTVDGGAGNDFISVEYVLGGSWDGGADVDSLDTTLDTFNGFTYDLSAVSFEIFGAVFKNFENVYDNQGGNTIIGSSVSNIVDGGGGADTINTGGGADRIVISGTGQGLDQVDGGTEADTLDLSGMLQFAWVSLAYNGNEVQAQDGLVWRGVANLTNVENVIGTRFADKIYGDGQANTLEGRAGNDVIYGRDGIDSLLGGADSDSLYGEAGNDRLYADAGSDYLNGGFNEDTFSFVAGTFGVGLDTLDGGQGVDTIDASNFTDIAWVDLAAVGYEVYTKNGAAWVSMANASGIENVIGSNQNDELYGDANNNRLEGGGGQDKLEGRSGVDVLIGGAGNDTLNGGDFVDTMDGGADNDTFILRSDLTGIDVIDGGTESDTVDCSAFLTKAWVDLNSATEVYTYNGAWKVIANTTSVENAIGSSVADELYGNTANNTFNGGAGADILQGRGGGDTLTGGTGSDTFKFAAGDSSILAALDRITDFAKGAVGVGDKFDFTAALTVGGSAAAATANQAQINAATGVVTFATGSGTDGVDALNDIYASLVAGGDSAGDFAFYRIGSGGPMYMLISDGAAGIGNGDVIIELTGLTAVNTINITAGDVTILT
jgi:microcystin-dependent protein/Ca2+-binding RTX toxin-like protein